MLNCLYQVHPEDSVYSSSLFGYFSKLILSLQQFKMTASRSSNVNVGRHVGKQA
jgi:hypothetical protein